MTDKASLKGTTALEPNTEYTKDSRGDLKIPEPKTMTDNKTEIIDGI
jgi:hypothetical protein